MKGNPKRNGRRFVNAWEEIIDLYHRVLDAFYTRRPDVARALQYCPRLEELLRQASPRHEAILGEECWSLIWEARGNLPRAIRFRQNQIRLMKKLFAISTPEQIQKGMVLYDWSDLSDCLDLLADLHDQAGDLDRAIRTLRQSKKLCADHDVPFDGSDMLEEFLAEKKKLARKSAGPARKRKPA